MSTTILSIKDYKSLDDLNKYLIRTIGIDFLKKLAELGFNEKKTEIDAKKFIEENYPSSNLAPKKTAEDKVLLLNFYFTAEKAYYSTERATTICVCEAKKNAWDDNFRAPSMSVFLQNTNPFEKSCAPAFFPLS